MMCLLPEYHSILHTRYVHSNTSYFTDASAADSLILRGILQDPRALCGKGGLLLRMHVRLLFSLASVDGELG